MHGNIIYIHGIKISRRATHIYYGFIEVVKHITDFTLVNVTQIKTGTMHCTIGAYVG